MAVLVTINIPDGANGTAIVEGLARKFGYDEYAAQVSNPPTKLQYVRALLKAKVKEMIVDMRRHEATQAAEAAIQQEAELIT